MDFSGYVDALGNLIDNPMDIIRDLLTTYYPVSYNANFFDTGEWEVAKAASSDVHFFADKPVEIEKIIEEICGSTFISIIPLTDGRYTARYFNPYAPVVQSFTKEKLLEIPSPTVDYDSTKMLRYVRVGYDRDWAESGDEAFKYYPYDSGEERVSRMQTFPTLLTNAADAQAFAERALQIVGMEYKPFDVKPKLQALGREIMDIIQVEIWRPKKKMLGTVKAEILGIHQDPEQAAMTLKCRITEVLPETVYVQGSYYGDSYYGDTYYSRTENQEVT